MAIENRPFNGPFQLHKGSYVDNIHGADGGLITSLESGTREAALLAASYDLYMALKRMDALMENLWKAVPWARTFGLDIALLNEVPGEVKRVLAKVEEE